MDRASWFSSTYALASILIISTVLRVMLCLSGGQDYWPDEHKENPDLILSGLIHRDYNEVLTGLDRPDRPVFAAIGVIPAAIGRVTGRPRMVSALFFSIASVVSIWVLAAIARELGADDVEALLAAALLALSASFLYWSRHVQPYDLATMFVLVALLVGVRAGATSQRMYLCGIISGVAFLTYPGYWSSVIAVPAICVIQGSVNRRDAVRHSLLAIVGVLSVLALAAVIDLAFGGYVLARFILYSGSINQGSFQEGWSLPFEYLWHAEHLLLVLWLASIVWALSRLDATARIGVGLFGALFIYAMLVVSSIGLYKFVVYGRMARQLVPFFCLITAAVMSSLWRSSRGSFRSAAAVIVSVAVVQALLNFWRPLVQSFPADFIARYRPSATIAAQYEGLIWLNAEHLYPGPDPVTLPPHYVTLAEARHPLEFLPYQYEGFTPEARAALRSSDIRMRFIGVLP
jgi:dolichyl-phosphate-mannose-protein mannosyltransferase